MFFRGRFVSEVTLNLDSNGCPQYFQNELDSANYGIVCNDNLSEIFWECEDCNYTSKKEIKNGT